MTITQNPDDFESFREDLLTSLDPRDALEGALAENIVAYLWRLRRFPRFEAMLYRRGCAELLVSQAEESVGLYESTAADRALASMVSMGKKEVAARDRQLHQDAEQKLARARADLDDPSLNVTRVLETTPQPFSNLWRHEAALIRSLLKMLHELERLQARRAGEHVPAPVVVDVDVSHREPPRADIGGTGPSGEADGHQQ